ncbi:hypothetical protein ACPA54_16420 [Uniformispora flossi]|uniref:hypothetical protein n=1 Tax=Uniformispora flossi TaxID=3390723 RepID=UPI003C2D76EF
MGFFYTDAEAASLHEHAGRIVAADPARAQRGRLNSNVAVPDPKSGKEVNDRTPVPMGKRRPMVWRTYREQDIHAAVDAAGLGSFTATYLYAHPEGLFSLQERSGADPLPRSGQPFAPHLPREFAEFCRRMDDVELPGGRDAVVPLASDSIAHLRTYSPSYSGRQHAPRTSADYAHLMACELEADVHLMLGRDNNLARLVGVSAELADHARGYLTDLPDYPLKPTHPDMHSDNLGVRNGHLFVYDLELVGYHDRRHAVAYAALNSRTTEFHKAATAEVVKTVPRPDREGFVEGLRAWHCFATLQSTATRVNRAEEAVRGAALTGGDVERTLNRFAPWLADRVNTAAPLWNSARTVDVTEVRAALAETARLQEERRLSREAGPPVGTAAIGMGGPVSRRTPQCRDNARPVLPAEPAAPLRPRSADHDRRCAREP